MIVAVNLLQLALLLVLLLVSLLHTGSIPNLEFDDCIAELNGLREEGG